MLPTEEWPANPETNVWYRLTLVVGHCGPISIAGEEERPPGIRYYNPGVIHTDAWQILRPGNRVSDGDSIPGFAKLSPEGDLEFSIDTVNARILYTATPVEDVPLCR